MLRGDPSPQFANWSVDFRLGSAADGDSDPQAVEADLGLDRATRRQLQVGLEAAGFDTGGADGRFGPRTRAAIRNWQVARSERATGYLDGAAVAALRPSAVGQPTLQQQEPRPSPSAAPAVSAVQQQPAAPSAEQENLFWQSIMTSTNPAEFEAYLAQFPNGVFRRLAEARLATLRTSASGSDGTGGGGGATTAPAGAQVPGAPAPPAGSWIPGAAGPGFSAAAAADADVRRRPGTVFQDCDVCLEMVVMPDGGLALGRYEVTVSEFRAFASATNSGAGSGDCFDHSWRALPFPQTDRHPVTCVSWDDAQEYLTWLSRTVGATYRLPTEAEWERAAEGSQRGCDRRRTGRRGTCPVGSYGFRVASGVSLE